MEDAASGALALIPMALLPAVVCATLFFPNAEDDEEGASAVNDAAEDNPSLAFFSSASRMAFLWLGSEAPAEACFGGGGLYSSKILLSSSSSSAKTSSSSSSSSSASGAASTSQAASRTSPSSSGSSSSSAEKSGSGDPMSKKSTSSFSVAGAALSSLFLSPTAATLESFSLPSTTDLLDFLCKDVSECFLASFDLEYFASLDFDLDLESLDSLVADSLECADFEYFDLEECEL